VSLPDFQRAFAVVVTDPTVWATRLSTADARIGTLQLSALELNRLRQLLRHPGMAANQVLLRANRAMPLYSALPLTCDWLRTEVVAVIDAWLADSHSASVQYEREVERFGAWLPRFLEQRGRLRHPALDALRFEQALAELLRLASTSAVNPVVDVDFDHDPDDVLRGWFAEIQPSERPIVARLRIIDGTVVLDRNPVS
jgi:hypothetical protein